jgi:GDP-4-dehydro-6-deoxy-D-mannose reductase
MPAAPSAILVTGAAGFVGRHLMPALAAAFPDAALLKPVLDVADPAQVEAAVRSATPDVCIHLAAVSSVPLAQRDPDHAWKVNFHGALNMAWMILRHAPDCQLLFVSSADAYGASFRSGLPLDESAPLAPMNAYAETKAAADLMLAGMAAQGLRVVRLRPFNHIGPGQAPQFAVAAFSRQIARIEAGLQAPVLQVGNLDTSRDFLDVRDVCAAYVGCIVRRDRLTPGMILNVASGQARRVGDVLNELAALSAADIQIEVDASRMRETDIRVACGNAARARERLDWTPIISWQQTLHDVLDDWRGRL